MQQLDQERKRIVDYLRQQLAEEERYQAALVLDPYTAAVYRRVRELGWTVSRFVDQARRLLSGADDRRAGLIAADAPIVGAQLDGPRIFIDVTSSVTSGKATGIQRVARETARHGAELGAAAPVIVRGGRLVSALRATAFEEISPRPGDMLLLLDAGWNHVDDYPPTIDWFRGQGGRIVASVFDLFPALYPALYTSKLIADFQAWLGSVVTQADDVVAISRASAESYLAYVKSAPHPCRAGQRVGWWRLGADFIEARDEDPGDKARGIAARGLFFLSVGTVEARKGYPVALAAFEQLWAEGVNVNFVIVGRCGWNATAFEARLRGHRELGRRLIWLDNANDAALRFLYRQTRGVVLPAFAEGFGLPLVEATQFGAPVIASNISVFREIAGDGARYFDLLDPASLVAQLRAALEGEKHATKIATLTWRESARELTSLLRSDDFQAVSNAPLGDLTNRSSDTSDFFN